MSTGDSDGTHIRAKGAERKAPEGGSLQRLVQGLRFTTRLRLAFTIVVIIGLVVHLALVYNTANSLSVEGRHVTNVAPTSLDGEYTVTFSITIDNPTRTSINVDRLTYKLYLEDDFLGEGEKAFFKVTTGTASYEFQVTFDAASLAGPTYTLFTQESATLRITGKVTVPAKVFGLWTYTHITVPYSQEEEVSSGGGTGPDPAPLPVVLSPAVYEPTASARLAWSMSGDFDFDRYEVHTSTSPDFTPSDATRVGTIRDQATTTHTVGGLGYLKTHYFIVRVYDDAGQHADSNRVSAFIP